MTLPAELLYAVLSMDSYNRGYDEGIKGLGGIGANVGGATILMESATDPSSPEVAASFYATAYKTATGIVISYRGTDDFAVDPLTGWTTGAGMRDVTARRPA